MIADGNVPALPRFGPGQQGGVRRPRPPGPGGTGSPCSGEKIKDNGHDYFAALSARPPRAGERRGGYLWHVSTRL